MYLWTEDVAGRGSDEIGSCLLKFLSQRQPGLPRVLYAISDNCGGQNKNWAIVQMWLDQVKSGNFDEIYHIFPVSGHTMLPCDRDFGHIEKHVRTHVQVVYTPDQWIEEVTKSRRRKPFQVNKMTREDFISLQPPQRRANLKSDSGQPLKFTEVRIFHFHKQWEGKLKVKYTFDEEEEEQTVDLSTRKRSTSRKEVVRAQVEPQPTPKYTEPRKIPAAKLKDVNDLLPYIPQVG